MADNFLIKWDEIGEHLYETGVDHCVLYPFNDTTKTYPTGVAWNGVSQITDNRSGADPNDVYADNIKYLSIRGAEDYGATVECYTTPPEFDECNGLAPLVSGVAGVNVAQQSRKAFGLTWRTKIGSDTNADLGYKYHILYNGTASPSEVSHQTINDSPEPDTMSYEITTIPIDVPSPLKPSANIEIDSTQFTTATEKELLDDFLQILYGTPADSTASPAVEAVDARLPLPAEVFTLFGGTTQQSQG